MILDTIAKRYGKLPTEVLSLDLDEYALNGIVLETALKFEASVRAGTPMLLHHGWDRDERMKEALDGALRRASGGRKSGGARRRAL